MRVLRGRGVTVGSDRDITRRAMEITGDTGERVIRVWTPHRQVAFGPRDRHTPSYETARESARDHGFEVAERSLGGRAVAYTGSTVAFIRTEPVDDIRSGMGTRYSQAVTDLQMALHRRGVHATPGEPSASFCPGSHSLQAVSDGDTTNTGKIAGIAQRIQRGVACVGGVVNVRDHGEIAAVTEEVYDSLGIPFDPDSVGSIEKSGGEGDSERVINEIEQSFISGTGTEYTIEDVQSGCT